MADLRTAYRAETFSELCVDCRTPTGERCFACDVPVCAKHAHLECVACDEPVAAACKRCGRGMCVEHRPIRRSHRCPTCEKDLWHLAGEVGSGNAPARGSDILAVSGFLSASLWAIPNELLAGIFGCAGVGWPVGKMIYIAAKRKAKVRQLRPDFIKTREKPRVRCP